MYQDQSQLWYPCSQMKDYETFPPLHIASAEGSYLTLSDGRQVIDAIASWWCKLLGHSHPVLQQAIVEQAYRFEHVILANTTHTILEELVEKLGCLMPGLNKVSFASDGSTAIDMAMKMSVHARYNQGQQRSHFIALSQGYHGESGLSLSVSDLGLYTAPYRDILHQEVSFLTDLPYVSSTDDPIWQDCSAYWSKIELQLAPLADCATAMIVEPLLQGAGGMRIYSADLLRRLSRWCKKHDVHLIVDEILTSHGRLGTFLACEQTGIEPDFICLGKNLTAGCLAMSALLTHQSMYDIFYADHKQQKAFLHSNTFAGNAIAANVALATCHLLSDGQIFKQVEQLQLDMRASFDRIATATGRIKNIRGIGGVVAADLITEFPDQRLGYEVFKVAAEKGALLRPLGNTLYWLPPLTIDQPTLESLEAITLKSLQSLTGSR